MITGSVLDAACFPALSFLDALIISSLYCWRRALRVATARGRAISGLCSGRTAEAGEGTAHDVTAPTSTSSAYEYKIRLDLWKTNSG